MSKRKPAPNTRLVGQTAVANYISTKFKVKCDAKLVSFWQRGERLPHGVTEFFPPPKRPN